MPARAEAFRLGVNYWPSESAMGWLQHYDPDVVRRDMGRIAAAGMDTVRLFLRWEDLQPTSHDVDPATLNHVVDAADAAADAGIDLVVTLFTGHMSGVNWIPPWALGGGDGDDRFRVVSASRVQPGRRVLRNWYTDPDLIVAQTHLAERVSQVLAGHPAVWAWDLGNENSNCTIPPDAAVAHRWLETMTSTLRASDPDVLITVGTHMEDLEYDRVIGPAEAARWCDFVCMHGYPAYAPWASGPSDEQLVPFLAAITAWLADDAPVLFAEFGQSTAPRGQMPVGHQVEETTAAGFTGWTLDALRDGGAIGALLWCYGDYDAKLFGDAPLDEATHERTFGLWRADGTPKPVVATITGRRGQLQLPPNGHRSWLDVTPGEFAGDRPRQLVRLYQRYRAFVDEPAVSQNGDDSHLR